jgi:hypothetical protein
LIWATALLVVFFTPGDMHLLPCRDAFAENFRCLMHRARIAGEPVLGD